MVLQQIYSNNLDPSQPNLTQRFSNAIGFFIDVPLLSSELEIDVFLQVYFNLGGREVARILPIARIEEQAILLNKTDTETLFTIPSELIDSSSEMALLFLSSDTTFLEVYIVKQSYNLNDELKIIKDKLDLILSRQREVIVSTNDTQQQFFFIN